MPSPLAHAAVGGLIARSYTRKSKDRSFILRITLICLFFSLAPDLDAIFGLLAGDIGRYHNQGTHSILALVFISALAAPFLARWVEHFSTRKMFGLVSLCYGLHMLMDFMTYGRGLKLAWPFSQARFRSPLLLFYGLRWSDGLISARHWITLANELAFVAVLLLLSRPLWKARQGKHKA